LGEKGESEGEGRQKTRIAMTTTLGRKRGGGEKRKGFPAGVACRGEENKKKKNPLSEKALG